MSHRVAHHGVKPSAVFPRIRNPLGSILSHHPSPQSYIAMSHPALPSPQNFVVLKELFDEAQRRRLASLGHKFLRAFRRERSRDWLPNRGSDRQLSIVYGPSSPWGKREALRVQREKHKQSEKVAADVGWKGEAQDE